MSKICIGLVVSRSKDFNFTKKKITDLFLSYDLGVFFDFAYIEPIIENYTQKELIFFSISDNSVIDNCDMLLLPDNCYYNGKRTEEKFIKRMEKLKNILQKLNDNIGIVELFVGESGTQLVEYQTITIEFNQFPQNATKQLNVVETQANIHYIFT